MRECIRCQEGVRRGVLLGLGLVMVASCQNSSQPAALDRLPDPLYMEHREEGPPSPGQPPAPKSESTSRPAESWLPPRGLSSRWNSIVIHHTATDVGSLNDVDRWHRGQGWDCCGYHFVIGNGTRSGNGQIQIGPRWRDQLTGAHTRLFGRPSGQDGNYYNEHGIGIALVGDFDRFSPTEQQMASLARLVDFLARTCGIPANRVYLHGQLKSTDCPGRYFSRSNLNNRLKALRAAGPG